MEESKRRRLDIHLFNLVVYTKCSEDLLLHMLHMDILDFVDIDTIRAIPTETGQASKFYEIIKTRVNSYPVLLEGLRKTNQHEIIQLLENGNLPATFNRLARTEKLFGKSKEPILFKVRSPCEIFSGREQEISELHSKIQLSNEHNHSHLENCTSVMKAVVISGVGGIGKTELCRKYIQLEKRKMFQNNVIWISAANQMSLVRSFTQLARDILRISTKNVDGKEKDIDGVVNEVYKHLERRKCLFVFDNAERGPHLVKFLPLSRLYPEDGIKPVVILTSRENEWELNFEVVKLGNLRKHEAVNMAIKGLGDEGRVPRSEIEYLVTRLHCFPLAILLATAFIREKKQLSPQCNIANYLYNFDKKEKEIFSLRNLPVCTMLKNDCAWTVLNTWMITVQIFRKTDENNGLVGRVATELMEYAAYMQPEAINKSTFHLLTGGKHSQEICDQALNVLLRYSIMTTETEEKNVFTVHPLVQEVTRMNTEMEKREHLRLSQILEVFSRNLDKSNNVQHAIMAWKYSPAELIKRFQTFPVSIIKCLYGSMNYVECAVFGLEVQDKLQTIDRNRIVNWPWGKTRCRKTIGLIQAQLDELKNIMELSTNFWPK